MASPKTRPSVSYSFVMRLPSVFNRAVVQRVATAVTEAAIKTRVARKGRPRR